ncbi:MAG: ABC transporter permease [Ignavibacteria bacterium]|nr:ABC transporter permease [Ignavibacteria bacterium]
MNRFLNFVWKEFLHIVRDYRTLLILFGMPIAQVLLFGFAITNEIKDAKIAILDFAKDNNTQEISNKLLSSGYFLLYENLQSQNDIEPAFRKGIIKEVIIFEPDFGKNIERTGTANVQIVADASDPNFANMLIGYTSSIIMDYQAELSKGKTLPPMINPEIKMRFNPNLKSVFMFVPGLMSVILLLVSALMTSISITKEKELGTMEILLVSPLNPFQIIVGKVIPYLLLALVNSAAVLILSKYVFEVPTVGSLPLLIAECTLFLVTALSLGILISTVSNNQQTAMMISLGALMLPTIILSGYIFPVENMPLPLQLLSNTIPAKWFIRIVKGIMLKGVTFSYIWQETLILAGMTVFFITVSIKKFKIRLE